MKAVSSPASASLALTPPADKNQLLFDTSSKVAGLLSSTIGSNKEQGLQLLEGALLMLNQPTGAAVSDAAELRGEFIDSFVASAKNAEKDASFQPSEESVIRSSQILQLLTAVPEEVSSNKLENIMDVINLVISDAKALSTPSSTNTTASTAYNLIASLESVGRAAQVAQVGRYEAWNCLRVLSPALNRSRALQSPVLRDVAAAAQSVGTTVLKGAVVGEQPTSIRSPSGSVSLAIATLDPSDARTILDVGPAKVTITGGEIAEKVRPHTPVPAPVLPPV